METGVGFLQPLFFIGVVENRIDPRAEGRVQVRAFGIHGSNRDVPTEDLPWSTLIIGNHDVNFTPPPLNAWVFGFFIDGRDAQQPMILGLIPSQLLDTVNPEVTGWGAVPSENYMIESQGSRPTDLGLSPLSRLSTGEFLNETYVAAQNSNRSLNIPIAGGSSPRTYNPGGNIGISTGEGDENQPTSQQNNAPQNNRRVSRSEQESIDALDNDPEFQAELQQLQQRYGITREQVYGIIAGESSYNPGIVNRYGYAGLFQMGTPALRDINARYGTNYTTSQVSRMSPAEQLRVYGQYLGRWNYRNSSGLGVMQAAPGFANRSGSDIIYPRGSSAWNANPGWRGPNGEITVDSINAYYNRRNPPPRIQDTASATQGSNPGGGDGGELPTQQPISREEQIRGRLREIDAELARLSTGPEDSTRRRELEEEKLRLEEELRSINGSGTTTPEPYAGYMDTASQATGSISSWDEPLSAYAAQYPYNRVTETASGHSIEIDDTPGAERIMIWHRNGSYIQISPTSTTHKSTTDSYNIHEGNHHVYIRGSNLVTIDGDMHLLVKGDMIEEIQGNYRQIVHGNSNMGAARRLEIQGGDRTDIRGSALGLDSNVENLTIRTNRNIVFESGETINFRSANIRLGASENLSISGSNALLLQSANGIHLRSGGNLFLNPDQNIFMRAEGGSISMQSRGSFRVNSEGFIAMKSSSTFYAKSDSHMILDTDSTMNINSSGFLSLKSNDSMFLNNTAGNLNISSSSGSILLESQTSTELKSNSTISVEASSNIGMKSGNIFGIDATDTRLSGNSMSLRSLNDLNVQASGAVGISGTTARLIGSSGAFLTGGAGGGGTVNIFGNVVRITPDPISGAVAGSAVTAATPPDVDLEGADEKEELEASFLSDPFGGGEFGTDSVAEQAQSAEEPIGAASAGTDGIPEPPTPSIPQNELIIQSDESPDINIDPGALEQSATEQTNRNSSFSLDDSLPTSLDQIPETISNAERTRLRDQINSRLFELTEIRSIWRNDMSVSFGDLNRVYDRIQQLEEIQQGLYPQ